jgi:hypothetical protein
LGQDCFNSRAGGLGRSSCRSTQRGSLRNGWSQDLWHQTPGRDHPVLTQGAHKRGIPTCPRTAATSTHWPLVELACCGGRSRNETHVGCASPSHDSAQDGGRALQAPLSQRDTHPSMKNAGRCASKGCMCHIPCYSPGASVPLRNGLALRLVPQTNHRPELLVHVIVDFLLCCRRPRPRLATPRQCRKHTRAPPVCADRPGMCLRPEHPRLLAEGSPRASQNLHPSLPLVLCGSSP